MLPIEYSFNAGRKTTFYFGDSVSNLKKLADVKNAVLIIDETVFEAHSKKFNGWRTIVLKVAEKLKTQATVDSVITQLLEMQVDRTTTLIGVGGGVVTDIVGYIASIFMRGINFGFVPTTVLAMVDASIGGKNGINVGVYKNMIGAINQPSFILHDISLLYSLPEKEWENGFAEIIKHAAIVDRTLFSYLEIQSVKYYQGRRTELASLLQQNAETKAKIVRKDEFEKGERKILNFGHSFGHAIENEYNLMHGHAISIGMAYAGIISEKITGFTQAQRLITLLDQYNLPVTGKFDKQKVFENLLKDKKIEQKSINYILLDRIGKASIHSIPVKKLEVYLTEAMNRVSSL